MQVLLLGRENHFLSQEAGLVQHSLACLLVEVLKHLVGVFEVAFLEDLLVLRLLRVGHVVDDVGHKASG